MESFGRAGSSSSRTRRLERFFDTTLQRVVEATISEERERVAKKREPVLEDHVGRIDLAQSFNAFDEVLNAASRISLERRFEDATRVVRETLERFVRGERFVRPRVDLEDHLVTRTMPERQIEVRLGEVEIARKPIAATEIPKRELP